METPASLDSIAAALRQALNQLPTEDVRQRIDDRAIRGWTESSRRLMRGLVLLASDLLAGVTGVFIAVGTWTLVSAGGTRPRPDDVPLLAMVFFLLPLALYAFGAYQGGRVRKDVSRLAAGVILAAAFGWAQARLFGRETADLPNRVAFLYSAILIITFAYGGRVLIDRLIRRGFRTGRLQRRLLVVGTSHEAATLREAVSRVSEADLKIVGSVAPVMSLQRVEALVAGDLDEADTATLRAIDDAVKKTKAHGLLVVSSVPFATLNTIMAHCFRLGLSVSLVPRVLQLIHGSINVRNSAVGPVIQIAPLRFDLPQLAIKRTMDVSFTVLGLAVIWPLMALIALAVKLDSRGPIFFSQVRAGLGGRPFSILKFRTMRVGAEAEKASLQHLNEYPDSRLFKIKDDPRVTRLGKLLRRSSLDELPQLFNVLRGQMSLVGPRPCVPEELEHYSDQHRARLFVVPGMTGPWQVSGRNAVLDFDQIVRMEADYIQSWSIASDLLILLKTIPAVFRGGAY